MSFTDKMNEELAKPLNSANVRPPAPGKYGEYIEGWKSIEEANRIFGFDGWNRETVEMIVVCEYQNGDKWNVGYRAKCRITISGVVREGTAVGSGVSRQLYDAHESACKEAETDAMKRALMTFGYPLGLALYDKSKANVCEAEPEPIPVITEAQRTELMGMLDNLNVPVGPFLQVGNISDLSELAADQFDLAKRWINKQAAKRAEQKEAA